jgi:flavin reductase (DIM6/NTAB) family NADH-FMN oxidoreductase RutF
MRDENTDAAERVSLIVGDLTDDMAYKLISAAVQPRPIAWITTVSAHGIGNLAPFSFFTVASRKPLAVAVSIGEDRMRPEGIKDTLRNIQTTHDFVVNIPTTDQITAVNDSSRSYPADIDELRQAGLTPVRSKSVAAPAIAGSLFSLECRLLDEMRIGTDTLVIGEVLAATHQPNLVDAKMHIDHSRAHFLGRLAGPHYCAVGDPIAPSTTPSQTRSNETLGLPKCAPREPG